MRFKAITLSVLFILPIVAKASTNLQWNNSVSEIIKPLKFEIDDSNKDVGAVFAHITYEMVKPCESLYIFTKSMSADGVVLNEASATHHNASTGNKYRDRLCCRQWLMAPMCR